MLVDLRSGSRRQGGSRPCPRLVRRRRRRRSAGGTSFAGDFVVASRPPAGRPVPRWLVLVDVSGKGEDAGTRSLLLSGALGGLLGALPARGVPRRAPTSSSARTGTRGSRPPSTSTSSYAPGVRRAHRRSPARWASSAAGSGRWQVLRVPGDRYSAWWRARCSPSTAGPARPGDVILLYTDGHGREAAAATSASASTG